MLINCLSDSSKLSEFINFIDNIFFICFFLIFVFFIISLLIHVSFLKIKFIKTINKFNQLEILGFIFIFINNLSILIVLNVFIQFYFVWIENTKDFKLSAIFNDIFMIILHWVYVWNIVLIKKNKPKSQYKKQNNKDLKFFVFAIKNDSLIMDKTIKYTEIFINGYKQIMII